jgi:hypothetical protein
MCHNRPRLQEMRAARDLFIWLNNPFEPPPVLEGIHDAQLTMEFAA